MRAAGARRCQGRSVIRRSSAARVMRDSQGCAGAVRVQSAVSAGAVAVTPSRVHEHTCLCMPGTYAYSPPRTAEGGIAGLPRWLARTLGWAWRGCTAARWTTTSAAFDSISVLLSVDRMHVSVPCSFMLENSVVSMQQQHQLSLLQVLQLVDKWLRRSRCAP